MICYTKKHQIPFQIDEKDFKTVSLFTWHVSHWYVATNLLLEREHDGSKFLVRQPLRLHLLLLGHAPEGLMWDHIDRDKLNNQRSNLHAVTRLENNQNRIGSSGVKGIQRIRGGWRVYVKGKDGKYIRVGERKELVDAIIIQDEANRGMSPVKDRKQIN